MRFGLLSIMYKDYCLNKDHILKSQSYKLGKSNYPKPNNFQNYKLSTT